MKEYKWPIKSKTSKCVLYFKISECEYYLYKILPSIFIKFNLMPWNKAMITIHLIVQKKKRFSSVSHVLKEN